MKRYWLRAIVGWLLLIALIVLVLPPALAATLSATGRLIARLPSVTGVERAPEQLTLAPLFTPTIDHWNADIQRWARQYDLDPNLLATVMQIESCGDDTVSSVAGAQGLFQVMPFHFTSGENQIDPDTNALRGANHLNFCLDYADGDTGLAMACYNGGHGVIDSPIESWYSETQRYHRWGTAIYADAQANVSESPALQSWLDAGGSVLCRRAAGTLGLTG
ncbi:MAG: transglycosylase SLT domain-containing protein [Chloroflexota bacterium]|nr:transglycosylase SLT domain-containing protein [Chloroflexota bacterium]